MDKTQNIRALSEILADYAANLPAGAVSVDNILDAFHERGFGILLLLFAAPLALPFTPPGINIVLAAPLLFLTLQQTLGARTVWMPEKFRRRAVSAEKLKTTLITLIPWMRRIEFFLRPRLGFITHGRLSRVIGLLGMIMALVCLIPVPGTNTVPSIGIALMAAGVSMRDGLAVIAGAFIGIGWAAMIVCAILFFGPEAFEIIKGAIASLFS